jgi:hypothetical protein
MASLRAAGATSNKSETRSKVGRFQVVPQFDFKLRHYQIPRQLDLLPIFSVQFITGCS